MNLTNSNNSSYLIQRLNIYRQHSSNLLKYKSLINNSKVGIVILLLKGTTLNLALTKLTNTFRHRFRHQGIKMNLKIHVNSHLQSNHTLDK